MMSDESDKTLRFHNEKTFTLWLHLRKIFILLNKALFSQSWISDCSDKFDQLFDASYGLIKLYHIKQHRIILVLINWYYVRNHLRQKVDEINTCNHFYNFSKQGFTIGMKLIEFWIINEQRHQVLFLGCRRWGCCYRGVVVRN